MPALNFQKQFVPPVESGDKRHSIRGYRKMPFKVGDKLALYYGMRTKQCRLLFRTVVTKVEDIKIHDKIPDMDRIVIEIDGNELARDEAEALAVRDGFRDHAHMMTWWIKNNRLPFCGQIIHWRYPGERDHDPHA